MSRKRQLRLGLAVCVLLPGAAEAATVQHSEPLRSYRVAGASAAKPTSADGPLKLEFNAFSRDFALELEPNGRLAGMQRELERGGNAAAYRGRIAGRRGSWARLVLTPAGPAGLVFDGETLFGLEAGADRAVPSADGAAAMFRLADVYFAPGEIGGEADTVAIDGEQAVAMIAQEVTALAAAGASLNLDLGAVADFEFSQALGASAETALLTRVNNIDGIFSEQLGVQITAAATQIFTSSDDPFTKSAASALLDELANYRGATPAQVEQGLTHLFTGRDLDGSTAGIAYFGSVCAQRNQFDTRSFGAGLSESRRGAVIDSLVAAHEMGHNFGAPHDGDANGACASTPTTFLMAPSINGSDRFSTCSVQRMQLEVASATCLSPIGPADLAVTLPRQTQTALAGASFSQAISIVNQGADTASGVALEATTEPGLGIVAVESGGANCTVAAGTASCALGAIEGGAARGVTLTLRAQAPGTFDVAAEVTADADTDASDDSAAATITVIAAVDLKLSGSASTAVVAAQTTVTALLENAADLAATSVAVTASLGAGLRPDSATLGTAPCTVADQSITCPSRTLAARETVALAIVATGVTAGSLAVNVAATSAEAERMPDDNLLATTVTVSAPPSDDGGGGGVSWWLVAALLAVLGERRRRSLPAPSAT